MSAIKAHAAAVTEKHSFYECLSYGDRFGYRQGVLSAASRLVTLMLETGRGRSLESVEAMGACADELHKLYNELVVVDEWSPAPSKSFGIGQ